jgi:hypothetical protein
MQTNTVFVIKLHLLPKIIFIIYFTKIVLNYILIGQTRTPDSTRVESFIAEYYL